MASIQSSTLTRLLSRLRRRNDSRDVLPGYAAPGFLQRHRWIALLAYATVIASYGAAVAYTGQTYIMQLAVPLLILAAFVIWALPESENAPVALVEKLFFAFMVALLVWPDYLAIDMLGLPWITAIRLTGFPLAAVLLLCLSTSTRFRQEIAEALSATPLTWKLVVIFAFITGATLVFSSDIGMSMNRFIVAQLNWTMIFFISVWVFSQPGRAMGLAYLVWGGVLLTCLIGVWEWRIQALPWAGHIPSFLAVDDPILQEILSAKQRLGTGLYRVQSKFLTPLGFAEFLAIATPVLLYFMVYGRSVIQRAAGGLTIILAGFCIIVTDSRLGVVGFFMSCLLFLLAWAVLRWRHVMGSVMGPTVTMAYPALLIAFMIATFTIGRLRVMVWGGNQQSFSNQAREDQLAGAIPMILQQPWGRGIGRGAAELGFVNPEGALTIDSYYLVIGLEFGIIGFLVYFGIFLSQLYYSSVNVLRIKTYEQLLIVPLTISLANFFVIKSILAQQENHSLIFAYTGAITALLWRIRQNSEETPVEFFSSEDGQCAQAKTLPVQERSQQ